MPEIVRMTAAVHPFKGTHKTIEFAEGVTVLEMVEKAQPDAAKMKHAIVFSDGNVIPRRIWGTYKPKAGELIEARAFPIPRGGGGGSGKNITRIVLSIAVIALSMWAGPALGAFFKLTGTALKIGSAIFSGITATVGMLAVNALCPIKSASLASLSGTAGTSDSNTLFLEGSSNSLTPFAVVPVVLGKHRVTPPLGSKPYTEMIGDDQYLRMLFVWGVGPVDIDESSLKIGDTLLSEFDDYKIEHREGYDTDEPLTLFPSLIHEEDFTVALTSADGWITRTTNINADEASVDFSFLSGLIEFDESGNKVSRAVNVEIQYRETDSGDPWSSIDISEGKFQFTGNNSWLNKTGDTLNSITFTGKKSSAAKYGLRFGFPTRGQYDVRIRRTTADTSSSLIYDLTYWTALRTITAESPINSPFPLAVTTLVIKATDQLNGVIDDFSGIVQTVCPDWDADTETWITRATNNPASLFRHTLQGNGMASPLADSRIDLEALQDWHEFCEEKGFCFNMYRDYSSSVWDALTDIAAAGRAAPTQIDGKWSVVIDREQTAPVSIITPRNSYDFKAEKFFLDPPHGWRIQFSNEDEDYHTDERRVYRDGYNDDNATKFESLELLGVTDPDQVYKLGRWRIAQTLNLTERWTFKQDMEYLTYKRGDWVKINHDVMIVGLASGRVKSVTVDAGNNVTAVTLDEEVIMESGKEYGLVIRTLSNPNLSGQVVTAEGATNTLTFSTPVSGIGSPASAAIQVGDVFCFGILGEETEDATIISIVPNSNLGASIIAIPYRPDIYDVDTEDIPEFVTKVSAQDSIPAPNVKSIVSDEASMVISSTGTLKVRVGIIFDPLNKNIFGTGNELVVQMRQSGTGEAFDPAVIEELGDGYVYIGDVRTKETIDIRLRFKVNGKLLPGPWTTISGHTVIGRSSSPAPLSNMTISVFGGQALIRWDKPAELDVLFGGEVVFRHSSLMDGANWSESVEIGQSAMARTLFAVLPLKEGTYLARVYDVDSNPSDEIVIVTTKQASVHPFVNIDSMDEAPSFLGTKDGTVLDGAILKIDEGSPEVLEGSYLFAQGFDLGSVQRCRLTTRITVSTYQISDTLDSRTENIDSWQDFDGSLESGANARIYVRHTDDDPGSSPVAWSEWERLESAEFEARAYEFKMVLTRDSADYNIAVSELGVDLDQIT